LKVWLAAAIVELPGAIKTVGLRFRDGFRADIAEGTATILDHHGLAGERAQLRAEIAHKDVGAGAGGEVADGFDLAGRIILCYGRMRRGERAESEDDGRDPRLETTKAHGRVPPSRLAFSPLYCRSGRGELLIARA
jgi:hypothetical protein